MTSAKMFFVTGAMILLILTLLAGYSYSQILSLSLPISEAFAIITLLLPLVTALSAQTAYNFLSSSSASFARPAIYLTILAFQLIYETVIATLSLVYLAPSSCRFEERWALLYSNKDADAIRRIQDRFACCGLNTVVDRAWPFPRGRPEEGHGVDQCERMFGRVTACLGLWRRAEQVSAGLFFAVAIVIFLVKSSVLIYNARNTSSWSRLSRSITAGGSANANQNGRTDRGRLAIGESDHLIAAEEEGYRDEVDSEPEEEVPVGGIGGSGSSRPRVEPSGVGIDDSVLWREGR